eukprot:4743360-Prymnesium_polylepis.1
MLQPSGQRITVQDCAVAFGFSGQSGRGGRAGTSSPDSSTAVCAYLGVPTRECGRAHRTLSRVRPKTWPQPASLVTPL